MASRFWVLGTGTWDGSNIVNWSATSGGLGGQTVPGSADSVTFDGSSGGGTVTVNTTVTVQSITAGAFTGTLDFSVNNNNATLSGTTGFSITGTGTRTLNLGSGLFSLTATSASTPWNAATTTGLTFNAGTSTIAITGTTTTGIRSFSGGGLSYATVTLSAGSTTAPSFVTISGANTIATLNIGSKTNITFPSLTTTVVTNALNWAGTSASDIVGIIGAAGATKSTISSANNGTIAFAFIQNLTFSGGGTFAATNSFDGSGNSGITITAPSGGGSGGRLISGSLAG